MQQNLNSEIRIVPYVEVNGSRTLSDWFLADIFDEMVVEGVISTMFDGAEMRDANDFIAMMKKPVNVPVFVLGKNPIGFAWLNGFGASHAYGHFCYFKNPECDSLRFGKLVLDYWFSLPGKIGPLLDVIIGSIPAFNTKASHYVQKLGFKKLGDIPSVYVNFETGERHAAMIHYLERPK